MRIRHKLKWWWLRLRRKTFMVVVTSGTQKGQERRARRGRGNVITLEKPFDAYVSADWAFVHK